MVEPAYQITLCMEIKGLGNKEGEIILNNRVLKEILFHLIPSACSVPTVLLVLYRPTLTDLSSMVIILTLTICFIRK